MNADIRQLVTHDVTHDIVQTDRRKTIVVKLYCGEPDPVGVVTVDKAGIIEAVERHGAYLRAHEHGDSIDRVASDKLHVAIYAEEWIDTDAIAAEIGERRCVYVDRGDGKRGEWIYSTWVVGS